MQDDDLILHALVDEYGRAAADNALELVAEANLLHDNDHKARAFALTILAAEELGKALISTMTVSHDNDESWQIFAEMVRGRKRHEMKLLSALFLIQQAAPLAGYPADRLAKELAELTSDDLSDAKMAALYVDIEGGKVVTPARVANHEGAQRRAKLLRSEIVGWAIPLSSDVEEDETSG